MGVLHGLGANVPRRGARILGLSSGRARMPHHPEACETSWCSDLGAGQAPPGFPQQVPRCAVSASIGDNIGLELTLRAPSNATGFAYDFNFHSDDYPEWVCFIYNDQFVAIVDPPPPGAIHGNVSFDSQQNPVGVNIDLFNVCEPSVHAPMVPCAFGSAQLWGTGFWGATG